MKDCKRRETTSRPWVFLDTRGCIYMSPHFSFYLRSNEGPEVASETRGWENKKQAPFFTLVSISVWSPVNVSITTFLPRVVTFNRETISYTSCCSMQRILQGEREGKGARWFSQAQGKATDRGRSQRLSRLDHAGRGHRAGDWRAEAGWEKYVCKTIGETQKRWT